VLEPCRTPWLDGVAEIEKSSAGGSGVTVRVTVVVCVVGGDV